MYAHTSGFDLEMTEYINNLRNGILEAYSGIFQGFKNSSKTQFLIPYASHILHFLDSIYMEKDMDDVVMKTAIGVLGDLADTLGSNAASLIQQSLSSRDFLNECLTSDDHMIKESAKWAKLAISRAISIVSMVRQQKYLFEGLQVVTNSCMHHLQSITDLCMSTIKS
ncbi:importin subunit beta-1-like protein, partial [Trifolium pratense]